ncbi:MAG: transcriptional regulator, partial [Porphyromonadaceae bacterium]|nr:transcriptional regulator [Porphyromonadaceae bacterium]
DLMRIVNGIIQSTPGVAATETLISLDVSFDRSIHIPDQIPQ